MMQSFPGIIERTWPATTAPADLWTETRDWLVEHDVDAPGRLPETAPLPAVRQGH